MGRKKRTLYLMVGLILLVCAVFGAAFLQYYTKWFHMPKGISVNAGGYIHFSVDDSNSIFEDLTKNAESYNSIFEQPKLKFIKQLHDQYGINVSFYVFYSWDAESDGFSLADATDEFKEEFLANANWLRFGFHAKDADAYEYIAAEEECEYYNKTINELIRITGSKKCIDNFVRLDRYQADIEMVNSLYLENNGIIGLLGADAPDRQSYALSSDEMSEMSLKDWYVDSIGISYTPTDIRLENIKSDQQFYQILAEVANQERIIIFTHEWILDDKEVQKYMTWLCQFAKENGIVFAFPEDKVIGE